MKKWLDIMYRNLCVEILVYKRDTEIDILRGFQAKNPPNAAPVLVFARFPLWR